MPPGPPRWAFLRWKRQEALLGAALVAIVAVSSYPALSAGFVMDDRIFAEAPAVLSWSGLWTIWFSPAEIDGERHYWPITYTTFWLEHKLWGITPFGTHLVNVLVYMASVLLLWRLLRHLAVPGAWAVAAVFAVHPMHVESVGLGNRTQGPAVRPLLHGRRALLDPFHRKFGRQAARVPGLHPRGASRTLRGSVGIVRGGHAVQGRWLSPCRWRSRSSSGGSRGG